MRRLDISAATLIENITLSAAEAIEVCGIPRSHFFRLIGTHDLFNDRRAGSGHPMAYRLKDVLHVRALYELTRLAGTPQLRGIAKRLERSYGALIAGDGVLTFTAGQGGPRLSDARGLPVSMTVDAWAIYDAIWPAFRRIAADKLGERGLPNAYHALDAFEEFMRLARLRGEAA